MIRKIGLFLVLCIVVHGNLISQISQKYSLKSYTIEDGLSQNSVYCLAHTKDGFLWLGTNEGLNRFDGQNFLNIKVQTNDSVNRSNIIFSILAIEGGLIIGTLEEVLFFDLISEDNIKRQNRG